LLDVDCRYWLAEDGTNTLPTIDSDTMSDAMNERAIQWPIVALSGCALIAFMWAGFDTRDWRHGAAVAVGGLAGIGLYHAAFGFTAAWRRLVRERRGEGFRAQVLLLGLTSLIAFPLIALGPDAGIPAYGNVLPMGVTSALGAFIFGVGMQLGGGCASGTLFTVGGGSTRMLLVLVMFITGSVWATADIPSFWNSLPRINGISLIRTAGLPGALALMLGALAALWLISRQLEIRRHGSLHASAGTASWLRGPWSPTAGAVALAMVGIATLVLTQRPWGVTAGFALWGAQIADASGIAATADWEYWTKPRWRAAQLNAGPFANYTSLMNFGIIFGAMIAAALASRWRPVLTLTRTELATAIVGGLLMGYGARLAYGCNIGAYLGGLISGSLHGWWWLVWGFAGSVLGTRLRERIGMDPPT
jgi:uncharacterized membrane protein YedE/YeeE